MILYLTYNDLPSGIYSSQVIDVVKFMRTEMKQPVQLMAFISIRGFTKNKKKIVDEIPDAIVLRMFPGVHRWRLNTARLKKICKKNNIGTIIGRSVIATKMAQLAKVNKVVYDGRGAIDAEWNEYSVVSNSKLLNEIPTMEKEVINDSDFRIAVSQQLAEHWRQKYNYGTNDHVVIPCTLNLVFENVPFNERSIADARLKLGLKADDIVFGYAGSLAGWQSFQLLYHFIKPFLSLPDCKIIFLSSVDENIERLKAEFPGKVICKKVGARQVPHYLIACDYGLLIREQSVTNKVASPVKFAEYLSCGLKVIISDQLGDYSELVKKNNFGHLYNEFREPVRLSISQKQTLRLMALSMFSKNKFITQYKKVLSI
jgi:hypothetical protein